MRSFADVVGQVRDMKLEELYQPAMVPRELICTRSDYFRAAFKGGFIESSSLSITLEETSIWTFQTFIGWLYTSRLILPQAPAELLGDQGQADDPTTWPFETLFELYIFADRFDTRLLRRLIIEQIIFKICSNGGYPLMSQIADLYEKLPRSSPLIRFLCFDAAERVGHDARLIRRQISAQLGDAPVAFWFLDDIETARAAMPWNCFECLLIRYPPSSRHTPCEKHASGPYNYNYLVHRWCCWHEHQNEDPESDEKLLCAHRLSRYEEMLEKFEGGTSERSRRDFFLNAVEL